MTRAAKSQKRTTQGKKVKPANVEAPEGSTRSDIKKADTGGKKPGDGLPLLCYDALFLVRKNKEVLDEGRRWTPRRTSRRDWALYRVGRTSGHEGMFTPSS